MRYSAILENLLQSPTHLIAVFSFRSRKSKIPQFRGPFWHYSFAFGTHNPKAPKNFDSSTPTLHALTFETFLQVSEFPSSSPLPPSHWSFSFLISNSEIFGCRAEEKKGESRGREGYIYLVGCLHCAMAVWGCVTCWLRGGILPEGS